MSSYYKYDNGNAFTLNEVDYNGYFHVVDGIAYTNKTSTDTSIPLTPKQTFLTDVFLNELEFDEQPKITTPSQINALDILDPTTVSSALENAHINNLIVFKNLIKVNPSIADFNPKTSHFYGLSSTPMDIRDDDEIYGKNVYTHIDPFSYDDEWAFLDDVISGVLLPRVDDTFLYICSTDNTRYTLSGSFTDNYPLQLVEAVTLTEQVYFYQDGIRDELFFVSPSKIEIYDLTNYLICGKLNLIDRIVVNIDVDKLHLAKIGENNRIEVTDDRIFIKNKYSNDVIKQIPYTDLGIDAVDAIDIRFADDYIILVDDDDIIIFDPFNISSTLHKTTFDKGEQIVRGVNFSEEDSNIFYLLLNYTIQTRYVNDPSTLVGISNGKSFLYLRDYIYNTVYEKYDKIQIKYNSNAMLSNAFNNLLYNTIQTNGYFYYLIHNIGRLYVSKTIPSETFYKTYIDIALGKNFIGLECGENSIGPTLNAQLLNLIKDTLLIYSKSQGSVDGDIVTPLKDLEFESKNLQMNGNETISVTALQRIFTLLSNIQQQILLGS